MSNEFLDSRNNLPAMEVEFNEWFGPEFEKKVAEINAVKPGLGSGTKELMRLAFFQGWIAREQSDG